MPTQYPTSPLRVSNASELTAALAAAQGGDTILLADGDYGNITLSQHFDTAVTIVADTPHGARFTGLHVAGAQNVTLDGLFLDDDFEDGDSLWNTQFSVTDSTGITLRNSLFEGDDLDSPGAPGDGYPTGRGFWIGRSDDVLIENNEFRTFWKALNVGKSTDVVIRGNDFHDIRSDGLNIVEAENVLVENNHFHDFRTSMATGDHPDMIQVWTTAGSVPRNLTFSGNHLDIGAGDTTHGIFIAHNPASRKAHGADIAFENITITDNVIVGRHVNGIVLGTTKGAVVANNTVLLPPDRPDALAPRITIDPRSTDVVLTDNMAANASRWGNLPDAWTVSGNVAPQFDAPHQADYFGDIFINALSGATNTLENLQLLPGSTAALSGTGSSLLTYDATPDMLTALARPETGAYANDIVFDGRFSAGPDGPAADSGATFLWDFGDGHTGSGAVVAHRYGAPGTYTAVLTVTRPDGSQDTTQILSRIDSPTLVSFEQTDPGITIETADGSTTLAPTEARTEEGALRFAWDTALLLPRAATEILENAQGLTISARITVEEGGKLLGVKYGFSVSVLDDGELRLYTPDGAFVTSGADLIDGAAHDIVIRFDGAAGAVRLSVDGATLLEAPAPMAALPDSIDSVMKLGAVRSYDGFTGTIEALEVEVNPQSYDFTAPDPAPEGAVGPDPDADPLVVTGQMEIGTLEVLQSGPDVWHSVSFSAEIPEARVVMGPLSCEGKQAGFARVRNVTDQGFEFQIDEWDYRDGRHVLETISWIAVSAGTHTLESGQTLTVGRIPAVDGIATPTTLDGFTAAPTLLTQITSATGAVPAVSQVCGVTRDGFDLKVQTQEAPAGVPGPESVDWIALEAADQFVFGTRLTAQVDDHWQNTGWTGQPDALLGAAQTDMDTDPSVLRYDLGQADRLRVHLQEDLSADAETDHLPEDVHLFIAQTGHYDLFG